VEASGLSPRLPRAKSGSGERHCVGVFPKVLQLNLNLLRTIPVIEEMTVRSEFLPDLTRIMNETKMTLMVKDF
jgi:hypothetical protein